MYSGIIEDITFNSTEKDNVLDSAKSLNEFSDTKIESEEKFNAPKVDDELIKYWWVNADKDYWKFIKNKKGETEKFYDVTISYNNGKEIKLFGSNTKKRDLLVANQIGSKDDRIISILEIIEIDNFFVNLKLIKEFDKNIYLSYHQVKLLPVFIQSELVKDNNRDVYYQLSKAEFDEIESFTGISKTNYLSNELTKTVLDNDGAYTSKDLLDIENDVRSFALILASKEIKPPLAIALFGEWGSGKSFFMEHLAKRVNELSISQGFLEKKDEVIRVGDIEEQLDFCQGIVQIKFNAWSYLDANLWAGMVSSIFEKLDEYISKRGKGENEIFELRKRLSDNLEILSSERETFQSAKSDLENQRRENDSKLAELIAEKNEIIENVANKKLSDIINSVVTGIVVSDDVKNDLEKYGITAKDINDLTPSELYEEVKSWGTFIKSFIYFSWKFIFVFIISGLILLIVLINPNQYFSDLLNEIGRNISMFLSITVPIFTKILSTFLNFSRLLKPISTNKNIFNRDIKAAEFQYENDKALLEINIRNKDVEINSAKSKLDEIDCQIEDIDNVLNNFVAEKAFKNFIRKKVKNNGYDKYLGIISIIRKDFETLSELFSETQIEKKGKDKNNAKGDLPSMDDKQIKDLFEEEKVIDRIILYIDDLDRCSDEKVLEVIQAVHLLMAFPLFNVVVGVDKRCVNNALIYKNLLQYSKYISLEKVEEIGIHVISPSEYLEKIFQIPFQLNDPNDSQIKGMVSSMLESQLEEVQLIEERTLDITKGVTNKLSEQLKTNLEDFSSFIGEDLDNSILEEDKLEPDLVAISPGNLKLSQEEIELLKEMSCIVGNIPRTIKRYLNIYRIIRTHQVLNLSPEHRTKEYLSVMFILAIQIGKYKKYSKIFIEFIESNKESNLSVILIKLNSKLKDNSDINEIMTIIGNSKAISNLYEIKCSQLCKHIPFVSRFSFGTAENNL